MKKAFEILNTVTDGISFQTPKKIKKHKRKEGDKHEPKDEDRDRGNPGGGNGGNDAKKCNIPATEEAKLIGPSKNVMQVSFHGGEH